MAGLMFLLCLGGQVCWADADLSDAALLARAEGAVEEGLREREDSARARRSFSQAADDYRKLIERGARNGHVYRNLGNALLLTDRLPEAIFAYRRGLELDPNDGELRADLEVARNRVHFPPGSFGRPPSDDWPPWLPRPSPARLLLLSAGFFALFWLSLTRYRMTLHGILLLLAGLNSIMAVALMIGALVEYSLHQHELERPFMVVVRDGVELRKGNGEHYPPRDGAPTLAAGMEGRLLGQRADRAGTVWLRIQLASGETGWLQRGDVLTEVDRDLSEEMK
jgi:tetratricopeptide (TPR) repeat protein